MQYPPPPEQNPNYPPPGSYPPNSGYPPSAPYPSASGYPPSAAVMGYPPPAGAPRRGGSGRTILLIASAVVVVAIAVVGYLRYSGPVRTVQNYLNAYFVQFDVRSANNLYCADSRASESTLTQEQQTLDASKGKFSVDISGINYQLVDEEFFGSVAHVRISGNLSVKDLTTGKSITSPVASNSNDTALLRSEGLGWCLTNQRS